MEQLINLSSNYVLVGILAGAILGGLSTTIRNIPGAIFKILLAQFTISVEISNSQDGFYWISQWFANHPYHTTATRLSLLTNIIINGTTQVNSGPENPPMMFVPGQGSHLLWHEGIPVVITKDRQERDGLGLTNKETVTLRVLKRHRTYLTHILRNAYKTASGGMAEKIRVLVNGAFTGWQDLGHRSKRPIETLILDNGLKEMLVNDLEMFLSKKAWYMSQGIPYTRGYLLYGPPGCGKTSIAVSLASHFDKPLCILNVSSVRNDTHLLSLVRTMPAAGILIIEDIDAIFSANRQKIDGDTGVSFSGLLNTLSGIGTPEGSIVIMTTNYKERLDPALIRPGRADLQIYIGPATIRQAEEMMVHFFPDIPKKFISTFGKFAEGMTLAEIQKLLLLSSGNHEEAIRLANEAVKLPR